jgi:uncharacterized membrane protein YeiH
MIGIIDLIEYAGTFAFAISGIRLASIKRFDWFGAYVVGLVTAIGGGTIRDVLLGLTPFWMMDSSYLICTAVALLFVVLFEKYFSRFKNTFFIFDTIGLGLFVVVGFEKTIANDFPFWVAIIMATMTGAAGGVMRDILVNEIPLIFRKEIYAMACVIGGLVYMVADYFGVEIFVKQVLSFSSVIITRILAVRFNICLPVLKGYSDEQGSA